MAEAADRVGDEREVEVGCGKYEVVVAEAVALDETAHARVLAWRAIPASARP